MDRVNCCYTTTSSLCIAYIVVVSLPSVSCVADLSGGTDLKDCRLKSGTIDSETRIGKREEKTKKNVFLTI